eukprot:bmy_16459T0
MSNCVIGRSSHDISFFLSSLNREGHGKISVFAVKMALATLCGGKIMDKLRYIFSMISDSSGVMVYGRYDQFLREVLKLPTAVFEGPSFGYTEQSARSCFSQQGLIECPVSSISNDIYIAVFHPVECSYCHSESMMGFRYRCQQCHNYQLCQDCFWRGHAGGSHSNQHQMKEYTSWKSPAKKLTNALSKSLSCASSREPLHPMFPDQPEKPLNLAHIVLPEGISASSPVAEEHSLIKLYVSQLDHSARMYEMSKCEEYHVGSPSLDDSLLWYSLQDPRW